MPENWSIYDPNSNDVGITPSELEARTSGNTLGDIVVIGNGLVTGKDKAFKIDPKMFHELNDDEKRCTKRIVKAKSLKKYTHDDATHYIWLNDENIKQEQDLKQNFPNFHRQLYQFTREGWKDRRERDRPLEDRYSYNKKIQWWEWVFLRNKEWLEKEDVKIFCPCKERHDKKEYVRFSLIRGEEVMPLQDVTAIVPLPHIKESAEFITAWLNSDVVYRWLAAKGHARGGVLEFSEAPLMRIPFRRIDFENPDEEKIHQKITLLLRNNPIGDTKQIEKLIEILINDREHKGRYAVKNGFTEEQLEEKLQLLAGKKVNAKGSGHARGKPCEELVLGTLRDEFPERTIMTQPQFLEEILRQNPFDADTRDITQKIDHLKSLIKPEVLPLLTGQGSGPSLSRWAKIDLDVNHPTGDQHPLHNQSDTADVIHAPMMLEPLENLQIIDVKNATRDADGNIRAGNSKSLKSN